LQICPHNPCHASLRVPRETASALSSRILQLSRPDPGNEYFDEALTEVISRLELLPALGSHSYQERLTRHIGPLPGRDFGRASRSVAQNALAAFNPGAVPALGEVRPHAAGSESGAAAPAAQHSRRRRVSTLNLRARRSAWSKSAGRFGRIVKCARLWWLAISAPQPKCARIRLPVSLAPYRQPHGIRAPAGGRAALEFLPRRPRWSQARAPRALECPVFQASLGCDWSNPPPYRPAPRATQLGVALPA
jgi:hypothetical protein